jgi:hypothetical protein
VALEFDDLTKNAVVTERLTCSFEFRVVTGQHLSAWYVIDGVDRIHVLARDGSGGEYVIVQPSGHAVCISSEGQAGTIAAELDEHLVAALHRTVTSSDCRSIPPRWQSRSKLHRLVQYRGQSNVWRIEGLIQFCSAATAR